MSNLLNPNFRLGLNLVRGATIDASGCQFNGNPNTQVSLLLDPSLFPSGLTSGTVYTIDLTVPSWAQGFINVIPGPSGVSNFLLNPGDPTTGLSYTAGGGETMITLRGTGAFGGTIATISDVALA